MLKTALLSNDTHPAPIFANATTALAGGTLNASTVGFVAVGNPLGWARQEITRVLLVDTPLPLGTVINVVDLRRQNTSIPSQMVCLGGRAFPWRSYIFNCLAMFFRFLTPCAMARGFIGLQTCRHWASRCML